MGNIFCNAPDVAHLAAVARDFCPFPDYSPGPLYNILSANSSDLLSEHYAAVQASLTPQQQQDFTRSLRSTFGKEGKVSYGGVGVVALSLAVLFDTVARQVKGEYVSDQEPIPGLFLKESRGTYTPPVYTVSKYLRLVPHIVNNPSRMAEETERYLHELKRVIVLANEAIKTTRLLEDVTAMNAGKCYMIAKHMLAHLQSTSNKTADLNNVDPFTHKDQEMVLNLNCDPKVASERFKAELDSLGDRTKEAFATCEMNEREKNVMENIATLEWIHMGVAHQFEKEIMLPQKDFDLKAKALGKWI